MAKKKSTKDILAALRAEAGAKSGGSPPAESAPSESASAESAPASEAAAPKAPAAKSGPAPKSTKDILAALRKEGASGGAKAEGAKPATKKPVAAKAGAATPTTGEKPSVQEMLKAAREGKPIEDKSAAPPPKKPVAAGAIRAAKNKEAQEEQDRRVFLLAWVYSPFVAAWVMLSAATGAFLLGMARFMMPNILVEPPSIFKVGGPGEFAPGTVSTKYIPEFGVWIVNTAYQGNQVIVALRAVCTHLGCTPSWLESEQKFKCPCHGSGFYIDGINFEGPAPRPLERVGIALAPDGLLEVDKSLTFQQEMGQWDDPASFYKVG